MAQSVPSGNDTTIGGTQRQESEEGTQRDLSCAEDVCQAFAVAVWRTVRELYLLKSVQGMFLKA